MYYFCTYFDKNYMPRGEAPTLFSPAGAAARTPPVSRFAFRAGGAYAHPSA